MADFTNADNVRKFAIENKMFSANRIGSDARADAMVKTKKGPSIFNKNPKEVFRADGKLSKDEERILVEEFGMDKKMVKNLNTNNPDVAKFLDELIHVSDGMINEVDIREARQKVLEKYLIGNNLNMEEGIEDELQILGFERSQVQKARVSENNEKALEQLGVVNRNITGLGDIPTQAQTVKMLTRQDKDGTEFIFVYPHGLTVEEFENAEEDKSIATLTQLKKGSPYFSCNGSYFKRDEKGNLVKFELKQNGELHAKGLESPREIRYEVAENENGNEVLRIFDKDDLEGEIPSYEFVKDGDVFKDEYGLMAQVGENGKITFKSKEPEVVPEPTVAKPTVQEAITKFKRSVNIDETGSTQRFTRKNVWQSNINVVGGQYTENGVPKKISIALPDDYGSGSSAKNKGKLMRTHMRLIDEEKMIYQAGTGRKFQLIVGEDGITLKQVEIDSAKTKAILDKQTSNLEEEAKKNGLDGDLKKVVIDTHEKANAVIKMLSNTNMAWEAYTTIGTNNGMHTKYKGKNTTGAGGGVFEQLIDNPNNGISKYSEIYPAIIGLLDRVPKRLKKTPEYRKAVEAANNLNRLGPIALNETSERGKLAHNLVRQLDYAMHELGTNVIAGTVQGANNAHNKSIVAARGKVKIVAENTHDKYMSDAVFQIGGNSYKLSNDGFLFFNHDVDFQDAVEYKKDGKFDDRPAFINVITGDNRHGVIKVDPERIENFKNHYFYNTATNQKYPVIVEDNVVFVTNGDKKVPLEDILNGKEDMPV